VWIAMPPDLGADFNDVLLDKTASARPVTRHVAA
jgi:hypothetical protein